ncbi:PREDICTED: nudC domain-containing protein 1 [Dinoponera quadriceps]|uniref:NudC domain-containing protein 1 n=1 Tax=Dinoponera quadriceps TaxID=609295 RepID=A0A6P3WN61_DINQU|nr:PREDICTED: nudC domain-containing protein 1 [Dinoponera quadriceps]
MTEIIELRPDKNLMNSSFEKYQFCTDVTPIISEISLKKHVYRLEPNQNQESWLEARLFAFHNHLYKNAHDMSCWFIDEDLAVWRFDKNNSFDKMHILRAAKAELSKMTYNPSIGFTSNEISAISDGGEKLDILIGNKRQNVKVFTADPVKPGVIMNVQHVQKGSRIIVTMCAIANDDPKKYTQLTLLSYNLEFVENEVKNITYIDRQILKVQGTIDYAYVEENGNYLHSICQDNISFDEGDVQKSEIKVEQPNIDSQIKIPKYYWSQDEDSLTVWVKIPKRCSAEQQPKISVKPLELCVAIGNEILIQGKCQHRLEENMATWRRKEDTLQIDVSKYESGLMWSELIKGDTGGERLPNETLAAEIHERLAHLCTDQQSDNSRDQPCVGFNAEQLEECDLEGRDNFLQRIDLSTRTTTHLARLGSNNHVLFTCERKHGQVICLRHDHDACVWMTDDTCDDGTRWDMRHIHNFPGFGYVEASKTNKKFCVAPINGSYIAIAEHARHIFLYEKPDIEAKTSKQRIIDLSYESSPIMGIVAMKTYLIVLLTDKLYCLQIPK